MTGKSPLSKRWRRAWHHARHGAPQVGKVLDRASIDRIEAQVARGEQGHSGQIRVCVEAALPLAQVWRGVTPREHALRLFSELRVWDTEHNNGVLIYLLLADHAIEIVADRGLARHVDAPAWRELIGSLQADLRAGAFERGLVAAIEAAATHLRRHFPVDPDATKSAPGDELPNRPFLL